MPNFSVGKSVLLRTPVVASGRSKKFTHEWHGPFNNTQVNLPNVLIKDSRKQNAPEVKVHVNRLKLFDAGTTSDEEVAEEEF